MLVVVIKRKPKKISRSSFAWELSRVNSFISFLFFSLGVERRRPQWKCWVALTCIIVDLIKSPYYLVFSFEWMFADSNLVQCTWTLIIIHTVRSCKWEAIMTICDEMIEMRKSWYELDLFCLCKYDLFIILDSAWMKHVCNDN